MSVEEFLAGFGLTIALLQPSLAEACVASANVVCVKPPIGQMSDDEPNIENAIESACVLSTGSITQVVFQPGTYIVNEGMTIPGGFVAARGIVQLCPLDLEGTGPIVANGSYSMTSTTLSLGGLAGTTGSPVAQAFTVNSAGGYFTYKDTVNGTSYTFSKSTVGSSPNFGIDALTINNLTFDASSTSSQAMNSSNELPVLSISSPVAPLIITNSAINNIPYGSGLKMLGWQGSGQGPYQGTLSVDSLSTGTNGNKTITLTAQSDTIHVGAFCVTGPACDPDFYVVGSSGGTLTMNKPLDDTLSAGTTLAFTAAFTIMNTPTVGQSFICADTIDQLAVGQTLFDPNPMKAFVNQLATPTYIAALPATSSVCPTKGTYEVDLSRPLAASLNTLDNVASASGFSNPTIQLYTTNIGLENPNGNENDAMSGNGFGIYATHSAFWANNGGSFTLAANYTFGSSIFMEDWENAYVGGAFTLNNVDGNALAQFHSPRRASSACVYMKGTYNQTVGGLSPTARLTCRGATGEGFETRHNASLTISHVSVHNVGYSGIGMASGHDNTIYDAILWDNGKPIQNSNPGLTYGIYINPYAQGPNGFQTGINIQWVCAYDDDTVPAQITQTFGIGSELHHQNGDNDASALSGTLGGTTNDVESIQGRNSSGVGLILPQVGTVTNGFGFVENTGTPTLPMPTGFTCPYNDPH